MNKSQFISATVACGRLVMAGINVKAVYFKAENGRACFAICDDVVETDLISNKPIDGPGRVVPGFRDGTDWKVKEQNIVDWIDEHERAVAAGTAYMHDCAIDDALNGRR